MVIKYTHKPNHATLHRLYTDERKTLKDIGDLYNTSQTTARNWLKAARVPLRSMSDSWNIRREKYNEKFSLLCGVDRKKTIERYGYDPADISSGSDKLIVVVCPNCGKERDIVAHGYKEGQCCGSCSKTGENHPIWGGHSAMLGRRHSESTKRRISASRIGKCTGESNCNYGKHLSIDAKNKLRITMSGRKASEETKKKISDAHTGEKHWNWQGGISSAPYCEKWTRGFRESIRKKYGHVCFICNKSEKDNGSKLSVHHTNYGKSCMCDYDCRFVPLCKSCNGKSNIYRYRWFTMIMCKLHLESSAQFLNIIYNI